jgi:hypothetical protein
VKESITMRVVRRLALVSLIALAAGCGGGGGGSDGSPAATEPAPGTTVVNGVAFSARSDVLTDSPFGQAFGLYTYRNVFTGQEADYLTTVMYTGTVAGNVKSVMSQTDFVDKNGQPITNNVLIDILRALSNAVNEGTLARAEDGWIYVTAIEGQPVSPPRRVYPSQVTTGTEWSRPGTHTKKNEQGEVIATIPTNRVYRVLAMDAVAPRSKYEGCVLLRMIRSEEGEPDEARWSYYKPGIGFVESTNVDPALDQSEAKATYLVPNFG